MGSEAPAGVVAAGTGLATAIMKPLPVLMSVSPNPNAVNKELAREVCDLQTGVFNTMGWLAITQLIHIGLDGLIHYDFDGGDAKSGCIDANRCGSGAWALRINALFLFSVYLLGYFGAKHRDKTLLRIFLVDAVLNAAFWIFSVLFMTFMSFNGAPQPGSPSYQACSDDPDCDVNVDITAEADDFHLLGESKMTNFVLKTRNCVLKTRNYVSKNAECCCRADP